MLMIQHFHRRTESTLGGGGNPVVRFKNVTVPVHETSLANQHFYSTLLGMQRVLSVCL